MSLNKYELRIPIRYFWKRGPSTGEAAKEICDAEGKRIVHGATASREYKFLNSGNICWEYQPRFRQTPALDNEDLLPNLENEPSSSSRSLATALGVDHKKGY
ncbi:unnamed protein product [Schistocephalus solidus]|uniref:Integrase n=1 Tax=Schistocephalus solidus TaxID=70667 RepID=A0A183T3Y9_SCHSO|nr:unnamed protein product [Schistocephalus solidus]